MHIVESAVRFAVSVLVALTAFSSVACDGGDDDAATPIPAEQRLLTAGDAPGTKPDPTANRQTTGVLAQFFAASRYRLIDPDEDEMTTVFQEAGFVGGGVDARLLGETAVPTEPHVFNSYVELESEQGAKSILDWLETDSTKPCPGSCAVQVDTFDVDIEDARGVHRSATAEAIELVGTKDQHPFDSYWVGFTEGTFVYTLELWGPPGSVTEEQAQQVASAYHDRLVGS
jgi:hypothetical protein